jgi:hypothetical protein
MASVFRRLASQRIPLTVGGMRFFFAPASRVSLRGAQRGSNLIGLSANRDEIAALRSQ